MNFVRSISGPRLDCSIGYADQVNDEILLVALALNDLFMWLFTKISLIKTHTGWMLRRSMDQQPQL